MPTDKINQIAGETGKPLGGPSGVTPKFDAPKGLEKVVKTLSNTFDIYSKVEKIGLRLKKLFSDQNKISEKSTKDITKEVKQLDYKNLALKDQNKILKENLALTKKQNTEAAKNAKNSIGSSFKSLVSAQAVIKKIGSSIKSDINRELENVTDNLGDNRVGWVAVGVAAIYASQKAKEYVETFQDAAIDFAKFRKNQSDIAKSTLIAPGGVRQLDDVRKSLGQTTDQFNDFLEIAKEAPFANAAEKLGVAAKALKDQFGGDQNKRLEKYVDLLKEIPTIDTDLSITASTDDTTAAYFALAEGGKVSTSIDLQSAGLLGGVKTPQTDQSKKDKNLLDAAQDSAATLENIKQEMLKFFPSFGPYFATTVGFLTSIVGGLASVATATGTTGLLLDKFYSDPVSTPAEEETVKRLDDLAVKLDSIDGGINQLNASGGIGGGGGGVEQGVEQAIEKEGVKSANLAVKEISAIEKVAVEQRGLSGIFKGLFSKFAQSKVGSTLGNFGTKGGGIASTIATKVASSFKNVGSGAFNAVKGAGARVAGTEAGQAALGAGAKLGISSASLLKGLGIGLIGEALKIAGGYVEEYGNTQLKAANLEKALIDKNSTAEDKAAASNKILYSASAKAGGALLKLGGAAIAGAAIGSAIPIIGTTIGAVVGASTQLLPFLKSYGTALKSFNDELKPGFLKNALNFAVVGPLSLLGLDISKVGGAMASVADRVDDLFSSPEQLKQKKIDAEVEEASLRLAKSQKSLETEQLSAQKIQQKSALTLERYFKQTENAANTAAAKLYDFGEELAGQKLENVAQVGGTGEQFTEATAEAAENATKRYQKVSQGLDIVRRDILKNGDLTAADRKIALNKVLAAELAAVKKFSTSIKSITAELANIPAVLANSLKSEIASKKLGLGVEFGGTKQNEAAQVTTENFQRSLESLVTTVDKSGDSFFQAAEGARAIADQDKKRSKEATDSLLSIKTFSANPDVANKEQKLAVKAQGLVKRDEGGNITKESASELQQVKKEATDYIKTVSDGLKKAKVLSASFDADLSSNLTDSTKALNDAQAEAEKNAKDIQANAGTIYGNKDAEKQAQLEAQKAEIASRIKPLQEEVNKHLDEQAVAYSDNEEVLNKLNPQQKEILSKVKAAGGISKLRDTLGNKDLAAQQDYETIQNKIKEVQIRENKVLGEQTQGAQQIASAISEATRVTDTTQQTLAAEAGIQEQILKQRQDLLEKAQSIIETTKRTVAANNDLLSAVEDQEKANTELEFAAEGENFAKAAGALNDSINAAREKTKLTVKGARDNAALFRKQEKETQAQADAIIATRDVLDSQIKDLQGKRAQVPGGSDQAGELDSKITAATKKRAEIEGNITNLANISKKFHTAATEQDKEAAIAAKNFANDIIDSTNKFKDAELGRIDRQLDAVNTTQQAFSDMGFSAGQILKLQQQGVALEAQKLGVSKDALASLEDQKKKLEATPGADPLEIDKLAKGIEVQRLEVIKQQFEVQRKALGAQRDAYEKLLAASFGALRSSAGARKQVGSDASIFGQNRVQLQSGLQQSGGSSTIEARQAKLAIAGAAGPLTGAQNIPSRNPLEGALGGNGLNFGGPKTIGQVKTTEKDSTKLLQSQVDQAKEQVSILGDIHSALTGSNKLDEKTYKLDKQDNKNTANIEKQTAETAKQTGDVATDTSVAAKSAKDVTKATKDAASTTKDAAATTADGIVTSNQGLNRLPKDIGNQQGKGPLADIADGISTLVKLVTSIALNVDKGAKSGDVISSLKSTKDDLVSTISGGFDDSRKAISERAKQSFLGDGSREIQAQDATRSQNEKDLASLLARTPSISPVPTPGGAASAGQTAQTVNINIKTEVEVKFDEDMFNAKVRQFVTKDPSLLNDLSKIFVSTH